MTAWGRANIDDNMLAFPITAALRESLHSVSVWAWTVVHHGYPPLFRRTMIGACLLLVVLTSTASAQTPKVADQPAADGETISIEQEVIGNILQQPLGDTTVESLDLPQPFLRRVAGRIIRSSYQHRYHVIAASEGSTLTPPDGSLPPTGSATIMDREQVSADSSKRKRDNQTIPSSKTWLYLIGLGVLIGAAAGALALRRSGRARR